MPCCMLVFTAYPEFQEIDYKAETNVWKLGFPSFDFRNF